MSLKSNELKAKINKRLTRRCKSLGVLGRETMAASVAAAATSFASKEPGACSHPAQRHSNLQMASPSNSTSFSKSLSTPSAVSIIWSFSSKTALWNLVILRWSFLEGCFDMGGTGFAAFSWITSRSTARSAWSEGSENVTVWPIRTCGGAWAKGNRHESPVEVWQSKEPPPW